MPPLVYPVTLSIRGTFEKKLNLSLGKKIVVFLVFFKLFFLSIFSVMKGMYSFLFFFNCVNVEDLLVQIGWLLEG